MLKSYASESSPNYAQAYIAYMRPDQFLDMTAGDLLTRLNVENEATEMDEAKLTEATRDQPIQLWIDSDGKVTGHEGRHRMVAMWNAGIRQVPVLLFNSENKLGKTAIDELTLTGQDNERGHNSKKVWGKGVLPLSYANRGAVAQGFATLSSNERRSEKVGLQKNVKFSLQTAPDGTQYV